MKTTLTLICAWCRASLGTAPCDPANAGLVSHGICATCAARLEAELAS